MNVSVVIAKDSRHRVHRENEIGQVDDHQRQEQGRCRADHLAGFLVGHLDEELLVMKLFGHAHMGRNIFDHRVLGESMSWLVIGRTQHA